MFDLKGSRNRGIENDNISYGYKILDDISIYYCNFHILNCTN